MEDMIMSNDDGAPFCGVPEELATQMTWDFDRGKLEFHFRHAKDEKAMLLRLSDWLEEDEKNPFRLAGWMQMYEASFRREAS
jgi:hypothetical protein